MTFNTDLDPQIPTTGLLIHPCPAQGLALFFSNVQDAKKIRGFPCFFAQYLSKFHVNLSSLITSY